MSQVETQQPVPDVEMNKFSKSDMANSAEKNDLEDDFEDDEFSLRIREARLNELKMKAREQEFAQLHKSDIYKEITEDEFLNLTTKSKLCIVHFYHHDFRRCDIMHSHLQKLAQKYTDVRFTKIDVEKAKFFVKKLNVQILPAVMCFNDGLLKHKIIGFEQLGNTDNFDTRVLEKKLIKLKFLKKNDNDDSLSGNESEDGHNDEDDDDSSRTKRSIISSKIFNKNNDYDSDD